MLYDILSPTAPKLPKRLPGLVKAAIQKVPNYIKPAAAQALFAPCSALMHDVSFRYNDNTVREPVCLEGVVGPSSVGKGFIDPVLEAIIRSLRAHDNQSYSKLEEYQRVCNTRGQNKDKPERPQDAAILVPEPDMTNAALIELLKDAEREGNRSLYTMLPELDLLDQCCAGHKKVTQVIRLDFDTKRYGAQRASTQGITGHPFLRWKFNFSCVEQTVRHFFRDNISDGTLGRIGLSYIVRPAGQHGIPRQGNYDEKYFRLLDAYLERLTSARGVIKVVRANQLIDKLNQELDTIVELSDDQTFKEIANRSLLIGFFIGCILYVSEGFKWTQIVEDFVLWSISYDLWSKICLFAPQMRKADDVEKVDVKKFGPINMLDLLTNTFLRCDLENLRASLGKPSYCTPQLDTWLGRGYITQDPESGVYSKTEAYLATHPTSPKS